MATIRDVARVSGVSVATVSYVLNDGPKPVREDTRQRVKAAMRALNYHPNGVARSLVRRRTHCLGILFGDVEPTIVTNYYVSGVLAGVFAKARSERYDVRLFTSYNDNPRAEHEIRAQQPDGVIVIAPPTECRMAERLSALEVPTVLVSSPEKRGSIPFVDVDNALGTRRAIEHLLSLGHRRIGHVMGSPRQYSAVVRCDTCRQVLEENGLALDDKDIIAQSFFQHEVYAAAYAALQRPDRPTALFAGNDNLALQAINAARDLGLRVPEDVSIVGHDDFPLAEFLTPALTTIRQPLSDIGVSATEMIFAQIAGEEPEQERLLAPPLILRGSTAPLAREAS